jgi:hypothetical protein
MSLQRLGTRNTLCSVGEVYGVAENIYLKNNEVFFGRFIILHLQQTYDQFPSPTLIGF